MNRIRYDEYLLAAALTLARWHRPVWSWARWRRVCRCGGELTCRGRHRMPISRENWPADEPAAPHPSPSWNEPTQIRSRTGPLMTRATEWRSSRAARPL
ncbi:hypothetical protein EAD89_15010 [Micromonospora sp. BL4]|nr:hypothetical protein EAD89_15010 [Micromonospora sp. BL4]